MLIRFVAKALPSRRRCAADTVEWIVASRLRSWMIALATVECRIGGRHEANGETEYGVERSHRVEAAVEAEDVLVEVCLQMLRLDTAVVRPQEPGLEVREDKVDPCLSGCHRHTLPKVC